jgi:hypothetical protein
MSQLVSISSPATGREMMERATMIRRSFFPPVRRAKAIRRILPCVVYAAPLEIPRPAPPIHDIEIEADLIGRMMPQRVKVADIIRATCDYCEVRVLDMMAQRRTRSLSRPRQIVMFLAREMTTYSTPQIGNMIGGRDHTTVMHGHRAILALIAAGDPIAGVVDAIRARLDRIREPS